MKKIALLIAAFLALSLPAVAQLDRPIGPGATPSPCAAFGTTAGTCAQGSASAFPTPTITNSLTSNVSLSNTANYFAGPTVAQGSTGTWCAYGNVSVADTSVLANFYAKLWDGTTVIDEGVVQSTGASVIESIHLSGCLASPAGNLTISVRDPTATTGVIVSDGTGSGSKKTATITAQRVN